MKRPALRGGSDQSARRRRRRPPPRGWARGSKGKGPKRGTRKRRARKGLEEPRGGGLKRKRKCVSCERQRVKRQAEAWGRKLQEEREEEEEEVA